MIKTMISQITDRNRDYRIRLFSILALGGIVISVFTFLISLFTSMWNTAIVSLILVVLSTSLIIYTNKTGKYQLAYMITVIVVFMICFPILFFTSGGHKSGTPAIFIFAVLFTVLMLDGKKALLFSLLEIIEYAIVCVFAYFYPQFVIFYDSEAAVLTDIIFAYSMVSIICGLSLYIHLQEYDRQREILAEQNEKLRRYDASRSVFLTTVSHEIKNPLNAINLHARDTIELMDEQPIDFDLMRENQEIIEKMVSRIDHILMDLKDTVAIEQGRLSLKLATMRTEKLIFEVARNYLGKNYSMDNELILNLDDNLPPITADYARITQVLTNLLSNAMQHTKNGTITITLTRRNKNQLICVSDNGEGIKEEIRQKALEGYVSTSEEYWRHGIGLYVCHQIIHAHGGDIWIESQLGKGTSVYFTLPYKEEL